MAASARAAKNQQPAPCYGADLVHLLNNGHLNLQPDGAPRWDTLQLVNARLRARLSFRVRYRLYATRRNAFRFHKKTRFANSSAPFTTSCALRSTDLATRPTCREVRFAWSRTAARRCFPRSGSRKNIKPPPKPIPAIPAIRPVLPCISSSPFQNCHSDSVTIAYRASWLLYLLLSGTVPKSNSRSNVRIRHARSPNGRSHTRRPPRHVAPSIRHRV